MALIRLILADQNLRNLRNLRIDFHCYRSAQGMTPVLSCPANHNLHILWYTLAIQQRYLGDTPVRLARCRNRPIWRPLSHLASGCADDARRST
jgi:hypothetical protein